MLGSCNAKYTSDSYSGSVGAADLIDKFAFNTQHWKHQKEAFTRQVLNFLEFALLVQFTGWDCGNWFAFIL